MDRGLLYDATADSDNPTPGYMLNEIASKIRFLLCSSFLFLLLSVSNALLYS